MSPLIIGLFTLVPFFKLLSYRGNVGLSVEHLDQLHSRPDSTLYHVLRCSLQEKFDTSVEHAIYPRSMVDPRLDIDGAAFHCMSFRLEATLSPR